ncbi:neural Wiskott-Aldrich syndrome protein-like [Ochotona curzoniae]|uniref:neural Wiskott-Aldrich syndrome protein-like n=1 Tax=Ochotona curzoniae TaxID=130825 RepID=UPI001B345C25|nr:neural Wiskott-Aldrich syndrome protein-like [Ochotona curzoniae]
MVVADRGLSRQPRGKEERLPPPPDSGLRGRSRNAFPGLVQRGPPTPWFRGRGNSPRHLGLGDAGSRRLRATQARNLSARPRLPAPGQTPNGAAEKGGRRWTWPPSGAPGRSAPAREDSASRAFPPTHHSPPPRSPSPDPWLALQPAAFSGSRASPSDAQGSLQPSCSLKKQQLQTPPPPARSLARLPGGRQGLCDRIVLGGGSGCGGTAGGRTALPVPPAPVAAGKKVFVPCHQLLPPRTLGGCGPRPGASQPAGSDLRR